jgi:hypothetical protein
MKNQSGLELITRKVGGGRIKGPLDSILCSTGKNEDWTKHRLQNIEWVEKLERTKGQAFGKNENRLHLKTTQAGEEIFIQYTGKESVKTPRKKKENVRPWDFRPKLKKANGEFAPDLSFYDIWDTIYQKLIDKNADKELGAILGILFYRMAFMNDHVNKIIPIKKIQIVGEKADKPKDLKSKSLWFYNPPKLALKRIGSTLDWCGMSFEGFLLYNDLLAWNEDCKYYYRDTKVNKKKWPADRTGRVNTLLTHLSIIGFHNERISLARLVERFMRRKGVAPATDDEAKAICWPYFE